MIAETRETIKIKPGRPARSDYEYQRNGTANLFMFFAPLEGWRHIKITDRRTTVDYAHALKDLADKHLPKAKRILLVQDNLNTHKPASLYEAFPPAETRGLSRALRMALHAKARLLAEYGRVRTRGSLKPMSRPADSR